MSALTMEWVEYDEYALRIDCAKQGCDPVHADDGELSAIKVTEVDAVREAPKGARINGHAATLVTRSVRVGAWKPVQS